MTYILPTRSLADILEEKRRLLEEQIATKNAEIEDNLKPLPAPTEDEDEDDAAVTTVNETFALNISLNKRQRQACELAFASKSFVLTGPAGTGKTTAQREVARTLWQQGKLKTHNFRIQGEGMRVDAPSIAFVAYTRVATGNIRRAIFKSEELKEVFQFNITTIHNLLEYEPEFYWNDELQKESMRFVPKRNRNNPLTLTHLIIEEATMVGIADLWPKLYDAMPPGVQIILLGDINQLQPVFGDSVFNYALMQLPVIELTHVYRQKEGSTILDNAHRILRGETELVEDDTFKVITGGETQVGQTKLANQIAATLPKWEASGLYNAETDIFLSPFNEQDLGTDNLNKHIAQHLGDKRGAVVYEVIAGRNVVYVAVGDKVFFNKQVFYVTKIFINANYSGRAPKPHSKDLLRFGGYRASSDSALHDDTFELSGYEYLDIDKKLDEEDKEATKRAASHVVEIVCEDTGEKLALRHAGEFGSQVFSLGYALTVHKAQGCEWRNVFIVLHKDHSVLAHRELLYTAVTRAREKIRVIGKHFMITKSIKAQRVKGNTLEDKIAYFNSGIKALANVKFFK